MPSNDNSAPESSDIFYRTGEKLPSVFSKDPFKACITPRPIGWISTHHPKHGSNLAPFSQFFQLSFDPPFIGFSSNQTPLHERKDTVRNIEETGSFVWNQADWDQRELVNSSAEWFDRGEDEFEKLGLEKEWATDVKVPMVKRSKIKFECKYYTTLRLPGNLPMGSVDLVIGQVVGIHIDSSILTGSSPTTSVSGGPRAVVENPKPAPLPQGIAGLIDYTLLRPIARLGYSQYAVIGRTSESEGSAATTDLFSMTIPLSDKEKRAKEEALKSGKPSALSDAINSGLEGSAAKNRALQKEQGK